MIGIYVEPVDLDIQFTKMILGFVGRSLYFEPSR